MRMGKTEAGHYRIVFAQKHPHAYGEDTLPTLFLNTRTETPPCVWGRPARCCAHVADSGNTPMRMGKTPLILAPNALSKKHPHAYGEDIFLAHKGPDQAETPPCVWGRRRRKGRCFSKRRNTPMRMGKTLATNH